MFLPAVLLSDFFSNREKYKPICARKNEYQKKKILIKIKNLKICVALPEATPSPFGTATLRLAPSALAPLGLRSAAKCAPPSATNPLRATQHLYLIYIDFKINIVIYIISYDEKSRNFTQNTKGDCQGNE